MMRIATPHSSTRSEATPLLGTLVGLALLMPAASVPELGFLGLPALVVLLPSLLFGMR
jgi:hypothetical protein